MSLRTTALVALGMVALTLGSARARAQSCTRNESMATRDSAMEMALVELRLGRVASRTVPVLRAGDDALLPAGALLDLAEIQYTRTPAGQLEATLEPDGAALVIDPERDSVRVGARRIPLPRAARCARDGELYVSSAVVGAVLGTHFAVDWRELVIVLEDPSRLPVARRIQREEARAAWAARTSEPVRPDLVVGLERRRWDGLVLDYTLTMPGSSPFAGSAYTASLGADVFGGSLEATAATIGTTGDGRLQGDVSWTGVWSESRTVQQLRVGNAIASGPNPRSLNGFYITNSPYMRSSEFGVMDYAGQLTPGWSVEAYRAGALVALDSVDASGHFGVRLPVQYGENPIDFVAYGPYGQVRTFNRTDRVSSELLPARHLEYGAAAGACTLLACRATGNLDVRYGLSSRWTLRTGIDQFWRDTLPALSHPYIALAASPARAWLVQLQGVANALAGASVQFEPSLDLRLAAEYAQYASGPVEPILVPAGWRSRWAATALVRPAGIGSAFYLEGVGDRIATATETMTRLRVGASLQRLDVRLLPYVRLERDAPIGGSPTTQPFAGFDAFVLPCAGWGSLLSGVWIHTMLEASDASHLSSAALTIARPIGRLLRVDIGASWVRGTPGTALTMVFTADRSRLRSYTTVAGTFGRTPDVTQYVQGSVLMNPATRDVELVPGPSLQRAGVTGRVFLDVNANGRWDRGEPLLPDVAVNVGNASARTDSTGVFRVWDVVPFEPVLVTMDSTTLQSPLWVPTFGSVSVVPGPNSFLRLDLPVAAGGVVEGRVVREAGTGARAVAGARLVLTNRRTGAKRTFTTFSDGAFSIIAVAPGSYDLVVDARDLSRVHGAASPLRVEVPPDANGARLTDLTLVVHDAGATGATGATGPTGPRTP